MHTLDSIILSEFIYNGLDINPTDERELGEKLNEAYWLGQYWAYYYRFFNWRLCKHLYNPPISNV